MRILMVGATGSNAGLVLPELVNRGHVVRALVRDEQRAGLAHTNGAAETAIGDLTDPTSLAAALDDVDGASALPEGPPRDGLTRMMAHYDRHGFVGGNGLVLEAILGRKPRSLLDYFRELATSQPPGATVNQ